MSNSLTPSPPRWILRRVLFSVCLAFPAGPLINGQTALLPPSPPRPTSPQPPASSEAIARLTAAKTIFLSNAGGNDYFNGEIPGGPNVSYNQLYAALRQWGHFQLLDSPAHADLIFQIRGAELAPDLAPAPDAYHIIAQQHQPQLVLTILDPATLTPIDIITTPAGRGSDIPKGSIAFARSVEWLTYQLSTRVPAPPSNPTAAPAAHDTLRPPFNTLIQFTAPVPPQVLNAKSMYLVNDAPTPKPNAKPDPYFSGFQTALNLWAYYHLADSPQSADLILHYHNDEANGTYFTLNDPATNTILWTLTDPHHGFYHQSGAHRVTALNQNLISLLKQLNHIPLTQTETAALH
jgi:hypothetical protein